MNSHIFKSREESTPAARSDTARASPGQLSDKAAKHLGAWSRVFKRWDWLEAAHKAGANPILLGHGVSALYEGRDEPVYLILLSMELGYEIIELGKQALLDCLHDFDDSGNGLIQIRNTEITLNIFDAVEGHPDHTLVSSYSLALRNDHTTMVLYYTGSDEPETIGTQERELPVVTRNRDEERKWTSKIYLIDFRLCLHPENPEETLAWCIIEPYPNYTYWVQAAGRPEILLSEEEEL